MSAYYNEIDPFAAKWLEQLISAGHIAPGDVDTRSIVDVKPEELEKYIQCHFFAGIGVWSYAARKAGWPDDKPLWTGSCPCQPFSAAGKRGGVDDERHLWPALHWLIQQCQPEVVFGEQVASSEIFGSKLEIDFAIAVRKRDTAKANKLAKKLVRQKGFTFQPRWIDLVHSDMEGLDYAFGYRAFPSAGVGAPHIRDRAFWVAHSNNEGSQGREERGDGSGQRATGPGSLVVGMAKPNSHGRETRSETAETVGHRNTTQSNGGDSGPGPTNGFWRDVDWLGCTDGKWRPVKPGLKPLVNGAPGRLVFSCANCETQVNLQKHVLRASEKKQDLFCPVCEGVGPHKCTEEMVPRAGLLRGYGNAINAEQARIFIQSAMG